MAVPDFQTLMKPVLELLAERGQLQFRQLLEAVCDRLQLSDEDMAEAVPSGQTRIDNRVGWAVSYLVQAGAVARPRRGYAEITDRGRDLLAAGHDRITVGVLQQFPEFEEFRQRTRTSRDRSVDSTTRGTETAEATPAELVEQAEREANAAVQAEFAPPRLRQATDLPRATRSQAADRHGLRRSH